MSPVEYKFVELSIVTDDSLSEAVNEWTQQGWVLDGIHFVTGQSSRRPQMAFISFTKLVTEAADADADAG
jgi:hypothetical protein